MHTNTITTCASLALIAGAASANHVDFMSDGNFNISGPGSTVVAGDPGNILGGLRYVGIDTVDGASSASMMAGNSFIDFENDSTAAGVLTLDYGDFMGGNGELNADFATDWDFVTVSFSDVVGTGVLSVSFESSSGAGSSASVVVDSAGDYSFGFEDVGYSMVDFNDIDRVTVTLMASEDADFRLTGFTREAVPAPASLAVLGLGGLCASRRRR